MPIPQTPQTRPTPATRSTTQGAGAARDTLPASASAQVLDALRAIGRAIRVSEPGADQRAGLHPAQRHALQQLAERPARSLTELAERTHTDPSSVSVVVQRLVERGLVTRTAAPNDRRRTELAATAAGRALLRRTPAAPTDRLERALEAIGEREATALARKLAALVAALDGQNGAH
jgi:DNA-binding MarR family transcriptional regulator